MLYAARARRVGKSKQMHIASSLSLRIEGGLRLIFCVGNELCGEESSSILERIDAFWRVLLSWSDVGILVGFVRTVATPVHSGAAFSTMYD
jgi:hypothetical protein